MHRCLSVFLFATLLVACDSSHWELPVLDPADSKARNLTANDSRGQRIVINYWAEWCKPCLTEIPELNHFAVQHAGHAILLGRNFDNLEGDALLAAMGKVQMAFPAVTVDPGTVFPLPEVTGLPTTVVLDEQGRLITVLLGPQTAASLESALSL